MERIGEPTRAKWRAFLDRALDLEYLSLEEYHERMEALLTAKTVEEIDDTVVFDFSNKDRKNWNEEWGKRRDKGLALPNRVTPAPVPRKRESINVDKFLADAVVALCIVGWAMFALVLLLG